MKQFTEKQRCAMASVVEILERARARRLAAQQQKEQRTK